MDEEVTQRSAAAEARPADAFKELLPLMKDPSVVGHAGTRGVPQLVQYSLEYSLELNWNHVAFWSGLRLGPFHRPCQLASVL